MKRTAAVLGLGLTAVLLQACSTTPTSNAPEMPSLSETALFQPSGQPEGTVQVKLPQYSEPVTAELRGNKVLFEGDILLAELSNEQIQKNSTVIANTGGLWPSARIPYVFASNVSSTVRSHVQSAINTYNTYTKVRIVPRASERNYVRVIVDNGCYSYVGRIGGAQSLSLSTGGCGVAGAIHEFGHALGLWHEQSRKDRDQYVTIVWANIKSGTEHNFQIESNSRAVGAYDFDSIMHYPAYAFSTNGKATIVPKNSSIPLSRLGAAKTLSSGDIAGIKSLYP
ncbi:M12 family metallopeptidase [Deinococcus cellulosilyticus]|uniref:Peptidase n=1 Tax=Deinococcus cellulosilyticus (strain DSM 18568 / NBRC 106333 / KACC 11606 / 5516J-15) TaxID=1223518 RepID=A0A511N7J7_DEIC1|nr:M12 family metallopeptidase [Deinococcus cellulosilyticus]GEM48477.1 peptidase [Deinococcus cellulosilyticus NBRC 106333 = KACC 11606]